MVLYVVDIENIFLFVWKVMRSVLEFIGNIFEVVNLIILVGEMGE